MAHSPDTAEASRRDAECWWEDTELEAGTATVIALSNLPRRGRLLNVKASRTAGSGASIRPWISTAASASAAAAAAAGTLVWQAGDPAVAADRPLGADALVEQPLGGAIYQSDSGTLHIYAGCSAADDNTVIWNVAIAANWTD